MSLLKAKIIRLKNLKKGKVFSQKIKITKQDVRSFCALSKDYSPIHAETKFAKVCGFRDRVAHGLLLGAKISCCLGMHFPGANFILQKIEMAFRKPVIPPINLKIQAKIKHVSLAARQISVDITLSAKNITYVECTAACVYLKRA